MIWPKSFQLVFLLKLPQFLLDAVEEVCALKATAAAVQTHDYGVEGADQHRGPVHLKLLRHHLTTGGAVPTRVHQIIRTCHAGGTPDQTKASKQHHSKCTISKLSFYFVFIWFLINPLGECYDEISGSNFTNYVPKIIYIIYKYCTDKKKYIYIFFTIIYNRICIFMGLNKIFLL